MMPVVLAWFLAAGAQTSGYRVAGIVIDSVDRRPVAGARVTLAPLEHRDQQIPFVTGADGHFAFLGISQGRFELQAERAGFLVDHPAGATVTGAGQPTGEIVLTLSPPGLISGKVTDDAGEPVANASVELLSSAIAGGRRRLTTIAVKQSDDAGEYRFTSLAAGSYYLAVSGFPWYTKLNQTHGDLPPRSITHAGYGIRYYPNASSPSAAAPLALKAGQHATADFSLFPVPAASVEVQVEGGEGLTKRFTLSAEGLGGNQVKVRQGTEAGDGYHFWGVPPGRYSVRVQASDDSHSWFASESADIGATDTEISLTLREAPSLAGTLMLEGGAPAQGASIELLDAAGGATVRIPVTAGGKFAIPLIEPQRYRVRLAGADGYFLSGWSVEGARREGETLEIGDASAVRLKVEASRGGGVSGNVYRDGHPLPYALVVLADTAHPDRSRAVTSDSDGGYEFRGVPPGAYALFAAADGEGLEYANPEAIRPYLESAKKIRVGTAGVSGQRVEAPAPTVSRPASASPAP